MLDAQGRAVSPDGSSFPAEKGAGEGKKGRHTKKKKKERQAYRQEDMLMVQQLGWRKWIDSKYSLR